VDDGYDGDRYWRDVPRHGDVMERAQRAVISGTTKRNRPTVLYSSNEPFSNVRLKRILI